ncbi:MAG: hypothetical protein K9L98_01165 [Candidatus Pacebacteria bacterium]|nr:hypothetical protein [Candidatus Paceibacterota bacterium]MCF7862601.1 hypothetical protein [Candidatus Paceibacterota bacterium]
MIIRKNISALLVSLAFFIFLANLGAIKFHWYYSIHWLDMLMHFLGGFWVAILAVFLFIPNKVSWQSVLKIVGFVLFIGIMWEFFEISLNSVTVKDDFDMIDTLSDVFFDTFGAFVAVLYLYFFTYNKNSVSSVEK